MKRQSRVYCHIYGDNILKFISLGVLVDVMTKLQVGELRNRVLLFKGLGGTLGPSSRH